MKIVRINLAGEARQAQFSLELESNLQSARDWLVAVSAFSKGERIATADLDWHYSARADTNFTYLNKTSGQKVVAFPLINSIRSFDSLEIHIIPWSKNALQLQDSPEIILCTFTISNHALIGSDVSSTVGTIGIIRDGE